MNVASKEILLDTSAVNHCSSGSYEFTSSGCFPKKDFGQKRNKNIVIMEVSFGLVLSLLISVSLGLSKR